MRSYKVLFLELDHLWPKWCWLIHTQTLMWNNMWFLMACCRVAVLLGRGDGLVYFFSVGLCCAAEQSCFCCLLRVVAE